jgi:hypothetical protein
MWLVAIVLYTAASDEHCDLFFRFRQGFLRVYRFFFTRRTSDANDSQAGVNFINILRAAFTASRSQKRQMTLLT